MTEKISYEKTDHVYRAVFLENQYLKVMVLPELGGRIQRAYDKTNGYDFVYYNHVIKPALVGLTGPCIRQALTYPENLGEGRLEGTRDNHLWYHLGLAEKEQGHEEEARRRFEKATEGSREIGSAMFYYDQPADMVLYQGLALRELGDEKGACACFNSLLDYGERHLEDRPQVDYFAVSLPDFLVFEEDRTLADQVHCHYLMGLACFGYGRKEEASRAFRRALELDNSHLNCRIYLEMAEETAG